MRHKQQLANSLSSPALCYKKVKATAFSALQILNISTSVIAF